MGCTGKKIQLFFIKQPFLTTINDTTQAQKLLALK
jgi:hypothetical protein